VKAEMVCCPADPLDWCAGCDTLVSSPLMVWADVDLYICYHCAGVSRPWHDIFTYEQVRG